MKKFLKGLLILLLIVEAPLVYADGEGDNNGGNNTETWGQTHTKGQFTYKIDGFVLNIYKIDTDSPEVTETNNAGNVTVTLTQDEKAYRDEQTTRSIELTPSQLTYNPTYTTDKFANVDTLFINLGASLTKEQLESLLAEEMQATTTTRKYIADLCVKYTFTEIPDRYTHFYNYDFLRIAERMASENPIPTLTMTNSNHQVINRIFITKEENQNAVLTFEKEANNDNFVNFVNMIALATKEINTAEESPDYYIMFHNISNVEFLYDEAESQNPINPITGTDTTNTIDTQETVEVGNTSKMMSGYIYVGSAILILSGIGIVFFVMRQKQKESEKRM